jgi:lipopolysaccharide export system permease protein
VIIDRYVTKEILRPFALGLGLLVLVFIGFSSAMHLKLAAEGKFDLLTAGKLIGLNTLVTLEILLPSALYFSVLAALGRLYRDGEMDALFSAGVSRLRLLLSVSLVALVIALVTGLVSIQGRPWAYRESYRLEARALAEFDLKKMDSGEFVSMGDSDYVFIAEDLDLEQGLHKNVFLHRRHSDGARSEIVVARAASMPTLHPEEPFSAEFFDGYNYLLDNRRELDVSMQFEHMTIRLPATEAQERYRRKAESTGLLQQSADAKDIAEYQWRVTTPLATILLALIAVPLARAAPRQSLTRSFFVAIAAYIVLFSLSSTVRTLVEQGRMPSMPCMLSAYAFFTLLFLALFNLDRLKSFRWRS